MSYTVEQQAPTSYIQIPQQCWLLQQPCDSGYGDGGDDLFAQAFDSYAPNMETTTQWTVPIQSPPLPYESCSSESSPFQYADSLVMSAENQLSQATELSPAWCFETPAAYMSGHDTDAVATDGTQDISQHQPKENSQPRALQPSLREDSCSAPNSRSRSRDHHTAVEQRYRNNLSQHFTKLRLAVPNIQTSQPQRGGLAAKPSKSEVLAGAVDYIKHLERENRKLRGLARQSFDLSQR